jgi:arsenate reductase-like glutaredoxin family protein
MVTIYGIKNCDTMKKARGWLESHKIAHLVRLEPRWKAG